MRFVAKGQMSQGSRNDVARLPGWPWDEGLYKLTRAGESQRVLPNTREGPSKLAKQRIYRQSIM